MKKFIFHHNEFLLPIVTQQSFPSYHVIMVNSASMRCETAKFLWNKSDKKICADGGANRLFDGFQTIEKASYIPDYITGDLDSVRDEVRDYYSLLGTSIVYNYDQNYNDLEKALHLASTILPHKYSSNNDNIILLDKLANENDVLQNVIVLGALGGRLDQQIANINTLYSMKSSFCRIVLLDDESTTFLLKGDADMTHEIRLIRENDIEGPVCGLLPLGHKVENIKTTGLKWNLENESLEMGKRISTSNQVLDGIDTVTVTTNTDILWTCTCKIPAI
eukprot:gene9946-13379_t